MHTIKGTCGFLGLPRLESLTHAAETLMAGFRAGRPVTTDAVSLVLATIDRIKTLLAGLERHQVEPRGDDGDLIARLQGMAAGDVCVGGISAAGDMSTADMSAADTSATDMTAADAIGPEPDSADGKIASSSIRLHIDTLDRLMTMVSELVLTRNALTEIARRHQDSEFNVPLARLSHITAELQEGVLKTRMQPIGNAWRKLPRIVRDLSAELKKPIGIEMVGADTELDRQVLELIKDPLTHMVRNAADHGLEMPEQRIAAGKPERGTIRLSACHERGHILIEISDDGRGLDIERIGAKALALGLASEADIARLTETQVQRFIFAPGVSTADHLTSVSGRGIGMDVVRANVDKIGGTVDVSSERGRGTVFTVKIPLTLAIVSALIIEVAGNRFAVPQHAVLELVRVRSRTELCIERIKDSAVLRLRNKLLPLVDLKTLLGIGSRRDGVESGFIVVMQVGIATFGLVVDGVFDTEEIVVKPMSSRLRQVAVFCGNTILGDGSVILILDPNGVAHAIGMPRTTKRSEHQDRAPAAVETPAEPMLVFRAGSPNPKAVPLALVTRLEEIDAGTIEILNGRPIVQYRGRLMPLVPATGDMTIKSSGIQPLLVFSDDRRSMGLVVDEIVDIVQDRLAIELVSETPGILGSAVINGQATEVIDIAHFLPLAFADWRSWKESATDTAIRRVLLIDDAPFFRNMLVPVVKAAGYVVTTVASASEALAVLESGQRFHFVLTDLELPGMTGFDLASALRANPRTAELPVIGLSSTVSSEAIERGKRAGLHDCVAKFDRRGLIAALKDRAAVASCA